MEIHRNVAFGQWRNCLLFFHVGSTCLVVGNKPNWCGTGIELLTPMNRFRFRLGGPALG